MKRDRHLDQAPPFWGILLASGKLAVNHAFMSYIAALRKMQGVKPSHKYAEGCKVVRVWGRKHDGELLWTDLSKFDPKKDGVFGRVESEEQRLARIAETKAKEATAKKARMMEMARQIAARVEEDTPDYGGYEDRDFRARRR